MNKNILLLHTGGTISMREDIKSGTVIQGDTNPLLEHTSLLEGLGNFTINEPFQLPSPHITAKEMLILKNIIEETIEQENIDGVVITHGTDTLEETAYFLDLTVKTEIPIVLTGAMRSINEIGSDGLYNLISAIRTASCESARGKGVLVVLNDEIHSALNVTKTHASNVSTFQSPQYGPLGIVSKRGVIFHHTPNFRETFEVQSADKKVALLKVHAGFDSTLLFALSHAEYDGVVLEALGQGNIPPQAVEGIKYLLSKNIPIVIVSRCFNGTADPVYGYEGGGKQLRDLGVIFANGLNGQKARIKLLAVLEALDDWDHNQLELIFNPIA
ncbi:L-asparaginase [Bacillus oleivorans]|uniref:asparaginase n=1 Tax=Bacillus oleivorans TaxID=1448271 RepID=A0A285CM31_9BACI|nr:asparaginase [Bacillus oleivorans]SNX68118.1 L-asparaginase [Bacillus oleivorans]